MDEKSVCANIQKLAEQLNSELKAAAELGLSVRLETTSRFSKGLAKQVSVRVWRETELVAVGTSLLDYKQWPIEAQLLLRDHLKKLSKDPPDKT